MENIVQGQWLRGPSADLGEPINQSLRFNSSGYLTRAQSAPLISDDRTWTFSTWFKHGKMGETQIFGIHQASSDNWLVAFTSGASYDTFLSRDYTGWQQYDSTQKFRDPNAWYHIFLTCSSGVMTMKVNNVARGGTVTQNHSMDRDFVLGAENNGGSTPMDAYLAETYFIQGTVLHPVNDGFIRLNADGVYVPDTPTISSYGTNGWHLTYDSSQTNGIGHDSSGNGNHFTATGFDTAAISSSHPHNDVDIKDTPTNNWTTLNRLNASTGATLTAGNLFYAQSSNSQGASASQELRSGKWYFEVQKSANHNPEIGIMPIQDSFSGTSISTGNYIAVVTNNATLLRDGTGSTDTINYTSMTGQGVIGCAIDMDAKKIWWTDLNGNWQASGNPATGANAGLDFTGLDCADGCVPHIQIHTSAAHSVFVKFGQMDFIYTPPTGFKAIQSNEQPEPTIKNGKEHFDVVTYAGTGSAQSITGLEFQPDFVWVKKRNGSESHRLADVIRGSTVGLASNNTNAETDVSTSISSFNSDGFTVVSAGQTNESGFNYVAWCWKAGTSYTPTVTGYTNPSASINKQAGFGIYKVTGTNTASSFTHGLNERPQFVIAKALDGAEHWAVFGPTASSDALSATATFQRLNETTPLTKGGNVLTAVSDTTLSFASYGEVAGTGDYIFYCWHSVEGYSKFGSYTGNGNDDGTFIYTGFSPAFIMYKKVNGANSWHIIDNKRDTSNPARTNLFADDALAEDTTYIRLDFLSNGFKQRSSFDANNVSGGEYIYMAFAEHPFGGENQPPATAR